MSLQNESNDVEVAALRPDFWQGYLLMSYLFRLQSNRTKYKICFDDRGGCHHRLLRHLSTFSPYLLAQFVAAA